MYTVYILYTVSICPVISRHFMDLTLHTFAQRKSDSISSTVTELQWEANPTDFLEGLDREDEVFWPTATLRRTLVDTGGFLIAFNPAYVMMLQQLHIWGGLKR